MVTELQSDVYIHGLWDHVLIHHAYKHEVNSLAGMTILLVTINSIIIT